tara:strand:+ start:63 stop:752 length:690 start_codon:yes stop_codon:yes gene_type:complete
MTFKIDILEHRKNRQVENYKKVKKLLSTNMNINDLKKHPLINADALDRYLEQGGSVNNLSDDAVLSLSMFIAVKSSRQGSKDELLIINGINDALQEWTLKKPQKEIRIDGIDKTIDAVLLDSNKTTISHIFCKVVDGDGGHQDNVRIETFHFLEYASKQDDGLLRVCLIDGNIKWKNNALKYTSDNVWVCDHLQFQEKLQKEYGVELKEIDNDNTVVYKNPIEELLSAN